MRDAQIVRGFAEHDSVINQLHRRLKELEKGVDKVYIQSLTHVMMWDVLFELLQAKGIFTREEFDASLKALSEKTKAAMDADRKAKAEEAAAPKVTVLSDEPAIEVVK